MLTSPGVTRLLIDWSHGDQSALEKLTPLIYDELHRLAAGYLRRQRPDHTLQATALVNETYVQLLERPEIEWQSRAHFIGMAAQMMHCVLVDHARRRAAQKRGGGAMKVSLSRARPITPEQNVDLIALDEAFARFAKAFPRQAQVFELHFFGGLNIDAIPKLLEADEIEVSQRTVERDLKFARAWLRREIDR